MSLLSAVHPRSLTRLALILLFLSLLSMDASAHSDGSWGEATAINPASPERSRMHRESEAARWSNPPGSIPRDPSFLDRLDFFSHRILESLFGAEVEIPADHALPPGQALADYHALEGHDSITWIGHATFLIRLDGMTILTDPFFAERASPVSWAGPKRAVPPAIAIDNLPPIDVVIVSHNHYDHLDAWTVERLAGKENIRVIVPEGLRSFFAERGYPHVQALQWWEKARIGPLVIQAFPAVHWSKRGLFDTNQTLWMSYGIRSDRHVLYHSGDSERHEDLFARIGEELGRCDWAMMAIGTYAPESIMRGSHMTPESALDMAQEIGCAKVVGHHWGTIRLSEEPFLEPMRRFLAAGEDRKIKIRPMAIGATMEL